MCDVDEAGAGSDRDDDVTGVQGEIDAPDRDFSSFFSAHCERLVRAMYLLTGDNLEAEDLSQEAFVRTYERWDRISRMKSPAGYLYRTALNLNRRRLRRVLRSVSGAHLRDASSSEDPEVAVAARTDVANAVRSLARGQREVVILREWLDLPIDELAELLGISPESARVRLHRARQVLRKRLEETHG